LIEYRNLRIALLGAGSVGAQVADQILNHGDELAARIGAGIELIGVAVRDPKSKRSVDIPAHLITTDAATLVRQADIVIELMGGVEPARTLILDAINSGADIVTANKALLAHHSTEIFDAAAQVGAQVYYEAAVAGAIPIIRPLRDSLAGDRVTRILGIVNGTTNFILDRIDTLGESMEDSLVMAKKLGYAEEDSSADVEGFDAAQKASILASLAFHTHVPIDLVYREGITAITLDQVRSARKAGYVVKLLAICERVTLADGTEGVSARVYPAMVPDSHPLAAVHGANNAVFVEAELAGPLMFYGAGAGGVQTASAVLGDLVSAARRHVIGGPGVAESTHATFPILPISEIRTRYHISLEIIDAPGVLADIASLFATHGVSVESAEQKVTSVDGQAATATLVIGTHEAIESDLAATVDALEASAVVQRVVGVIRMEGL
jgi:homoserine dehydrogenase